MGIPSVSYETGDRSRVARVLLRIVSEVIVQTLLIFLYLNLDICMCKRDIVFHFGILECLNK